MQTIFLRTLISFLFIPGRKVVAVEPKWNTIKRLQKSAKLNNFTERFTIVMNAIVESRGKLLLYSNNQNQGKTFDFK